MEGIEIEQQEIVIIDVEPGVRKYTPEKDPRGFEHSDVYLYQLDKMDEDQLARYGLVGTYERYKRAKEK